jgi:hypothetical protein
MEKTKQRFFFVRLNAGWEDPKFTAKLNSLSGKCETKGWKYYDIKITSNGNKCLVIFTK